MIATPNISVESLGWNIGMLQGFAWDVISLFLILFLITIGLYSAYEGVRTSILRSMYYVVIPLLWVFSFGLIYMVIEML